MDVADPSALESVLRRHGVRAASSLGQRFLVDRGVLRAILDAAELSAAGTLPLTPCMILSSGRYSRLDPWRDSTSTLVTLP